MGCKCESVGAAAAEHLITQGCERIAHVGPSAKRRLGVEWALAERHLRLEPGLNMKTKKFSYQSGTNAALRLLASGKAFDGVVTQSDQQSLALVNVLTSMGKSVPSDVRVIGVDDSPICHLCPISLSSVSQQFEERGQMAVDLLLKMIGGETCESVEFEPVVRHRHSS